MRKEKIMKALRCQSCGTPSKVKVKNNMKQHGEVVCLFCKLERDKYYHHKRCKKERVE